MGWTTSLPAEGAPGPIAYDFAAVLAFAAIRILPFLMVAWLVFLALGRGSDRFGIAAVAAIIAVG